ncbi:hypothetical protein NKV53_02615 [Legionella sp. 27cVA30]|uniref:hypothetical protein n=1 Tax=Legionella sp. 27cVA30 TaxID=2905657 RepID=UPI00209F8589|nr:hypothetical protein [Legionella sp. 27cVA30]MCP0913261.1 hypothetical protein [Legionella sp. 27cVA30]
MIRLSRLIRNQGKFLLENYWHALIAAIALALLPYTAWLSVAIIALITLRRGVRDGGFVLIVTVLAYFISLTTLSYKNAAISSLLTFLPCYLGACVLRLTASWRAVAGAFFLQVFLVMLLLQTCAPDFILAQYHYIYTAIKEMQTESVLLDFINDNDLSPLLLANYLLGVQAVGVLFSAVLSLFLARSVQSQLFYPGGFSREILGFRAEKIGLLLLAAFLWAASQENALAMNVLPALIVYFLAAGLSLGFALFGRKPIGALLLIVPIFLVPLVIVPVFVLFGSLDSLFNFRLYISNQADKRI